MDMVELRGWKLMQAKVGVWTVMLLMFLSSQRYLKNKIFRELNLII